MLRNWKGWARSAVLLALGCAATVVMGQPVSGDWRTYGGSSSRQGANAAPASLYGPGRSNLIWWRPNISDTLGQTYVIDNLSLTINGTPQAATFPIGAWGAPVNASAEALNPFIPAPYVNADPATNPSYRYHPTTPANNVATPEVPQVAGLHGAAQWQFDFATFGDPTPRSYALYVWIPLGSTNIGGILRYPQRYWVYEIFFGSGQRWVEIVDTYAAGTGWIRLGGGGLSSSVSFTYDGATPVRIVLHNTVPLNDAGNPTDTPGSTLVYADAAMAVPLQGSYKASPVVSEFGVGGPAFTHTVAAINDTKTGFVRTGDPTTVTTGRVVSYNFANGLTRWEYQPRVESEHVTFMDNTSAGAAAGLGWSGQTLPATHFGANYFSAPITNTLGAETATTYSPTLDPGSYDIYIWVPGDGGVPPLFGTQVMVEVAEGTVVTQLTVNQSANGGWVRVGTESYIHDPVGGDDLQLRITNYSPNGGDLGRFAYADAVRFVGAADLAINSTPVTVDALVRLAPAGPLVNRSVTLVADESGRIHCLDSQGLGNGKTQVLWTYPSTPDPNNSSWTDPNHVAGEDGSGPQAEMPTGFNLSSALVERIDGEDWLFIGASNGRVYKISMAGRGDMNATLNLPGTTTRAWSFPNDYPTRPLPGNLGPIEGSIAYSEISPADARIYIPTTQGRMYCVDARGNMANKTTVVRWAFPALNAPNKGAIVGTPAVAFGNIYFGTQQVNDASPGEFWALNADTGAAVWNANGSSTALASDFNSGPVAIPAAEMTGMPDTVVVANDNLWITAYNALTGVELWTTNELQGTVIGNLSFTHQTAFDNLSVLGSAPVVLVPISDGRIMSLFAETVRTNVFGGNNRLAWGFETAGALTAQLAVGRSWMYAADESGTLYGFNDSVGGAFSPGPPPGQQMIAPNDPAGIPFRESRIVFINRATYNALREPEGAAGHLSHAQATNAANIVGRTGFEWGETIYAMVYNFPYELDSNPGGLPPQVNFRFSVEGAAVRNLTINSKRFSNPGTAPVSPITGEQLDGYAVTSFTLQGSGATALPPGLAEASYTINAQFSAGGRMQSVAVNPATSTRNFAIANPIGVSVRNPNGVVDPLHAIGYTNNPDDIDALVNGSPDVAHPTYPGRNESLLLSRVGTVPHGQQGASLVYLFDRSMMYLIRGPGRGLDGLRLLRRDMAWQGGATTIYKPINQARYPLTEQLPVNFPNDSLDYPNITREFITAVKDKFGNAENPVYGGVSLTPPNIIPGGDPTLPGDRTLVPTPLDLEVAVPRFQPPNLWNNNPTPIIDSIGASTDVGYYGNLQVFIDSSGNGQLDRRGRRETFRTFWLGGNVAPDERIEIETPTIDLGSLTQGAGYSPVAPYAGGPFSPWSAGYATFFKEFVVRNIGNTNMNQLRVAKATDSGAALTSWGLFAPANHERSWMDTMFSLWSDIDSRYAMADPLSVSNEVLLQKPRVGDRTGTELLTNPRRRDNAFLDVSSGPVFPIGNAIPNRPEGVYPDPTIARPRVAVTVPIGTPVGTYVTTLRVIEDYDRNESLRIDGNGSPLEPYTDPTFTVRFNVREGRLTNNFTRGASPMVDNPAPANAPFLYKNVQPTAFRDLAGQLVVAYASNKAAFNDPQPADAMLADPYRVYIGTVNGSPQPALGPANPQNPLRDLLNWSDPGTGRWFNQAAGPLPDLTATPLNTLFNAGAGENMLAQTAKFGGASFPILGRFNPINNNLMPGAYLAYLGQAEKQTPNGRISETIIVLHRVDVDGAGAVTLQGPWVMNYDATMGKNRPAIVQSDDRATVFYAGSGAGSNALYYSHFDGATFAQPQPISLGAGFESFGTTSVSARNYTGLSVPGLASGTPILEMTFSGKLRGRAHSEIYFVRLNSDTRLTPVNVPGTRSPILTLPRRPRERLVAEGEPGTYHAQGLLWQNPNNDANPNHIVVEQYLNGTWTNLDLTPAGTPRTMDRETGIVSFQTRLGGRCYIDPALGTVRFSGTMPARNAMIALSYTPRVLRVSTSGGSAYSGPSGLFDNRFVSELSYWADDLNQRVDEADQILSGRFVFTYSRAAAGTGAAARPFMRTMRMGIQLPTAIHTRPDGTLTGGITINGIPAGSYYQVDPANGRIYFTANCENAAIRVTYTPADEATGSALPVFTYPPVAEPPATITLVGERSESPIPIEQAVNESQLFSFIDPINIVPAPNGFYNNMRPNLIWMVYTSTRAGGPDIYFQTIAPRLTPVATGQGG